LEHFPPATEISAQRAACASTPAAIGNASRRYGIEKKVPNEATAHPAAITSMTYRKICADGREPEQEAGADQEHDDAGIRQARDSQR
jgi:hypothetical protein